jgi:hypothetical protein
MGMAKEDDGMTETLIILGFFELLKMLIGLFVQAQQPAARPNPMLSRDPKTWDQLKAEVLGLGRMEELVKNNDVKGVEVLVTSLAASESQKQLAVVAVAALTQLGPVAALRTVEALEQSYVSQELKLA